MNSLRMTAVISFLLLIAACNPPGAAGLTTAPTRSTFNPIEVPWSDLSTHENAWFDEAYLPAVELDRTTQYHMEITIADDFNTVEGRELILYTNNETVPLDAIYLRLFPNISGGDVQVHSVTITGDTIEPVYESQRSAVRLPLATPLPPGESLEIGLEFEVSIPREMGGNYGLFGYFDGYLVLDTFYPMVPAYDEDGWQRQATPPNGDPTYNDASLYVVQVHAPAGVTLLATGVEVDRREQDGLQHVTFASGLARDFYLAAAPDLEVLERQVDGTTVRSYAPAENREHAELALEVGVNALKSFETHFGPYPYPEMELIGTPMQALGIEYPGVMGIRLGLYDENGSLDGIPTSIYMESTVAHEVAHQWFYNLVGNNQVEEPWLDEALAQYATYLYYQDAYGPSAAAGLRASWDDRWDRTEQADIPIGMPADEYQGAEYGSIVYGRGPIFIEALSEAMGQESFERFLLVYVKQHAWGTASTESFMALAEAECACELSTLFDEWVAPND